MIRRLLNRRWKKIAACLLMLSAAVLILMPYGIEFGLKRLITANGADGARIENVDFNPFTGRLKLTDLEVTVGEEWPLKLAEARLNVTWLPFFQKRAQITEILINGADITIERLPEGRWRLGGVVAGMLAPSEEKDDGSSWQFGLREVQIQNSRVLFLTEKFRSLLQIDHWHIRRVFSWQPEQFAQVDFVGKLDDSPFEFSGEVTPFSENRRSSFTLSAGEVALKPFAGLLEPVMTGLEGTLSVDSEIKMTQSADGSLSAAHTGTIGLKRTSLEVSGAAFEAEKIEFAGQAAIEMPHAGTSAVSVNGKLDGRQLSLMQPTPARDLRIAALGWSGKISFDQQAASGKFEIEGDLDGSGLIAASGGDRLEEDSLSWKGAAKGALDEDGSGLHVAATGSLSGKKFRTELATAGLQAEHAGFSYDGKIETRKTAENADIRLDGTMALQEGRAVSENFSITDERLDWTGKVALVLPHPTGEVSVHVDGRLEGGNAEIQLPAQRFESRHSRLSWEGNLAYLDKENIAVFTADGSAGLEDLTLDSPELAAAEKTINWSGSLQADVPKLTGTAAFILDGKLDSGPLQMTLAAKRLNVSHDSFVWNGPLSFGAPERLPNTEGAGTLQIQNLSVVDVDKRYLFMAAGKIAAQALQPAGTSGVTGDSVRIENLEVLKALRAGDNAPLLKTANLAVESFDITPGEKIVLGTVAIDDLWMNPTRKADGSWAFSEGIALLLSPDGSKRAPAGGSGKTPAPLEFALGAFEIRGDSHIDFEDKSVTPMFRTRLSLKNLRLTDLDSSAADRKSPFKLDGKIGKYTDVDLEGSVQPFGERLSMDLSGTIDDLSLPPFSPYIVNTIGYKFSSGQSDINIDMSIDQGKLSGETRFVFQQLRAEAEDAEILKQREVKRTIPLETAFSLLRDTDGRIKLRVPISGDIRDPQFSISDAVNQALVKAAQKASLSYLKYALGPYGLAIAAAEAGYQLATQYGGIRLEPVTFAPGLAELDRDADDYLDKLVTILKDRPEARIRVCGLAVPADRSAMLENTPAGEDRTDIAPVQGGQTDAGESTTQPPAPSLESPAASIEALQALARKRAEVIKDALVDRHGIEDDRILLCLPEVDRQEGEPPRAEILF